MFKGEWKYIKCQNDSDYDGEWHQVGRTGEDWYLDGVRMPRTGKVKFSAKRTDSVDDHDWTTVQKHLEKIRPEMEAISKALTEKHQKYFEYIDFGKIGQTQAIRLEIVMENVVKGIICLIDLIQLWERVVQLHSVEAITEDSGSSNVGSSPTGAIHFTQKIGDVEQSGSSPD